MPSDTDLRWDDLGFFLHASRTRTLTGAARIMRVEHTTVGRRLLALERALGAPLVLRGPEGLSLTALGERIAPLVEELARTVQTIRDIAQQEGHRLRLSVPSGFTRFFSLLVARLRETHPHVVLELSSGSQPADLKKGEADLAIRIGPVGDPELVARKVGEAGASLYASKSYLERHPKLDDIENLRGHDLIGYDLSLLELPAAAWVEQHGAEAKVVMRSREMADMMTAAASGLGLAVLPCLLGDPEPSLVRLTPRVLATRPISVVYRREGRVSPELRAAVQLASEVMREHANALRGER